MKTGRVNVDAAALQKLVKVVKDLAELGPGRPDDIPIQAISHAAQEAIIAFGQDVSPAKNLAELETELSYAYKTSYDLKGLLSRLRDWYKKRLSRAYLDTDDKIWDEVGDILDPRHQPLVVEHDTVWDQVEKEL